LVPGGSDAAKAGGAHSLSALDPGSRRASSTGSTG